MTWVVAWGVGKVGVPADSISLYEGCRKGINSRKNTIAANIAVASIKMNILPPRLERLL